MRSVKFLRLHAPLFLPIIGEIGITVPGKKELPGLKMETCVEGVLITFNKDQVLVPWPNIVLAQLIAEAPKPAAVKPVKAS